MSGLIRGALVCCCVAAVCAASGCACAAEGKVELQVSIRPAEVASGEPCVVTATLKNTGRRRVPLDLGAWGIEAFKFEIMDDEGRVVSRSDYLRIGGLAESGKVEVEAGSSLKRRLVLNMWCSTLHPKGMYALVCHLRTPKGEVAAKTVLRIAEVDEKALRKTFYGLVSAASDRGASFEDRILASRMLLSSRSPACIPALARVARGNTGDQVPAVARLQYFKSIEATKALVDLALSGEVHDAVRRRADSAVRAIYRFAKDAAIRRECEKLIDHEKAQGK